MSLAQYHIPSPVGDLYLVASEKGLQSIDWKKQPVKIIRSLDCSVAAEKILDEASIQLKEYFSGQRKNFTVPFDLKGTAFQKKVWAELARIPFGRTVSYRDIARRIKNPKAFRAVGSANGKNPVCVIIPCHRVIAADGSIGGYSGGIKIKQILLAIEQVRL